MAGIVPTCLTTSLDVLGLSCNLVQITITPFCNVHNVARYSANFPNNLPPAAKPSLFLLGSWELNMFYAFGVSLYSVTSLFCSLQFSLYTILCWMSSKQVQFCSPTNSESERNRGRPMQWNLHWLFNPLVHLNSPLKLHRHHYDVVVRLRQRFPNKDRPLYVNQSAFVGFLNFGIRVESDCIVLSLVQGKNCVNGPALT